MCHRLVLCLIVFAFSGGRLCAAEAFDAAAFVKSLRAPIDVQIETLELEKPGRRAQIHTMEFSADVKTLCAVQIDGLIVKWDVATGKIKSTRQVRTSRLRAKLGEAADTYTKIYALSKDHRRVGILMRGGDIVFYDVEKEEVISQVDPELKGDCHSLVLSSDGKYALIGGPAARGAVVIDTNTGKKVFVHDAPKSDILYVGISPNDEWAQFFERDSVSHMFPLLGGEGGSHKFEPRRGISHFKATNAGALLVSQFQLLNLTTFGANRDLPMRIKVPARVATSVDSRYFILYAGGDVEIRSMQSPSLSWSGNFAEDKPVMFAIGSDGRTLAIESKEATKLKLFSALPEHPTARERRLLCQLLEDKKFAELKAIGKQLHLEQAMSFVYDPLGAPIDCMGSHLTGSGWGPLLFEWAEHDNQALLPKLLLAEFYIGEAWDHRGGGTADKVTDEGWRGFHDNIAKAKALIEPLCAQANAPAPVRTRLLTIAMAESWPEDKWMPHAEWMIKNAPTYVRGHGQVVQMLLPRWGGKFGDSNRYATRVADAIGGIEGDAMYAKIWLYVFDVHRQNPNVLPELAMDLERIKRGLAHLSEKSANPTYFAHRGLDVCFRSKDKAGAKWYADKLGDPLKNCDAGWWPYPLDLPKAVEFATSMP